MRFSPFAFIVAVALVSCGGGSSSPAVSTATRAPVAYPPQSGNWSSSLGPWNAQTSGKLNAVAIDPNDPAVIYVGGGVGTTDGVTTDAGVFKTTNGGQSWSAVDGGLNDTTINALAIDPNGAVLAATESGGIERSTNGAQNWTQVSSAGAVRQLQFSGSAWYAAAREGIFTSNDGISWSLLAATPAGANALAVSANALYAGLTDGSFVRVRNGSVQTLSSFPSFDTPPVVHAIAVDPNDASSIFATVTGMVNGAYSDALFHSGDGGSSWQQVAVPPALRGAQAIAFSVTTPHRLYVAGTGLAYTDDGATFVITNGYGDARTLTVGSGDRLTIASDQGVASGTFGGSFASMTAGMPVNIVRSVAAHGSTLLVTMQDFPPAVSTDGGATWQSLNVGSSENGTAFINPNAPNVCYVVDVGVDVSTDGCSTFAQQQIGGHLSSTQPIATAPGTARTYVLTANGAYVANDGVTFSSARWEVPSPVDVAIGPNDAQSIFASSSTGGVRVWHSSDGGRTFTPSAVLAPPGPSYPGDVPVLAVDPANGKIVIAVTDTALYRSNDGGATFTALHQTYTSQSLLTRPLARDLDEAAEATSSASYNVGEHVAFVPTQAGNMLIFSTTQGVYASLDDGTTIKPVSNGAISHVFEGFSFDGGRLCAGTDGQGVVCADPSTIASALN